MASRFTKFLPEERGDLPELTDEEISLREVANGVRQFKRMVDLIREELASGDAFRIDPAVVTEFNALALEGLDPAPGAFRTDGVEILGSRHRPPPWQDIPALLDECCDYLRNNWTTATSIHLAAYAMWRINWIHPFMNGNGRTSRAVSYLVLCAHMGELLPGAPTIPEMIARDRRPYYKALHKADSAQLRKHAVDVSYMERLIEEYLEIQLESAFGPEPA